MFKVGSSHVAAGVFNFLGGTVEILNHLVFPAGVKQQRLFFCVQSLRDNPLVFTTPMGGISVAKSANKLTHEWYLRCIGLQCPRTQPRGHYIESIPLWRDTVLTRHSRVYQSYAGNCRRPNRNVLADDAWKSRDETIASEKVVTVPLRDENRVSVLLVLAIISPSVSTSSLISSASTRTASHRSASLFSSISIPAVDLICPNHGLLKCANTGHKRIASGRERSLQV